MDFRKGALLYKCKHPFCCLATMSEQLSFTLGNPPMTLCPATDPEQWTSEQVNKIWALWDREPKIFPPFHWLHGGVLSQWQKHGDVNCASLKHLDLRMKLHQAVLGTNLLLVFLEFPISLHHGVPSTHPLFHELPPCYVETWLSHFYNL